MPQSNNDAGTGAPVENAQEVSSAEQPAQQESDNSGLMDALGIPAEVQAQISKGKAEESGAEDGPEARRTGQAGKPELPEAQGQQKDADDGPTREDEGDGSLDEGSTAESEGEGETEAEGEGEEVEEQPHKGESPFKDPRVQQRIDKLARQRRRAEERSRELEEQIEIFKGQGQKQRQQELDPAQPNVLAKVANEAELNQVVGGARALRNYCKANKDGVQNGESFISPETVAGWRETAEDTILNAEQRRTELRDEAQGMQQWVTERQKADGQARTQFPALFDEESQDYKDAVELVQAEPWIARRSDAHLLLGTWLEGKKALAMKNGNGAHGQNARSTSQAGSLSHPDIPEGVRRQRLNPPIAPVRAGRPSSHAGPSTARKVDGAMQNVLASGGDRDAIAAAYGALSEANAKDKSGGRERVAV